jgi:hypothetical protein
MSNITNQLGFVTNPQFSGGEAVTPLSGSEFAWQNRGYGGIYVGTPGTLVVKTINGNVLTLVSASGYIPGLIGAVSSSSTAANIIGFDPIPVALPTTSTSTSTSTTTAAPTTTSTTAAPTTTSTTTVAPTTSTTTEAPSAVITLYSGSYTGTPGSATITGVGSVCYYSAGGGYPGSLISESLFIPTAVLWGTANTGSVQLYKDSGLTVLFTGSAIVGELGAMGRDLSQGASGGVVRWFNTASNTFTNPQSC